LSDIIIIIIIIRAAATFYTALTDY